MKLVKIEHWRCNEPLWGEETYVFAPDEWDEEEIERRLLAAQEAYLETVKAYKDAPRPNKATRFSQPRYSDYPDLTVEEVQQIHERERAEYKEWEEKQRAARRPFIQFLTEQGFVYPSTAADVEVTLDWGHRHGWSIEIPKEINSGDVRLRKEGP